MMDTNLYVASQIDAMMKKVDERLEELENYIKQSQPQPSHNIAIYSMVDKDGKRVPPTKEYEEHLMEKLKRGDYDF